MADFNPYGSPSTEVADQIAGAVGIPTWLAAAAPADNVSLAEAIRWINDAIQGANGVVTFPSGAAPANAVNLAEVIRDIWDAARNGTGGAEPETDRAIMDYLGVSPAFFVPGLGYKVSKTENINTATGVDLFTITGKVLVTLLSGEVTNALGAAVTDYKLRIKTDNIDICAAADISSAAIGTIYSLSGDATDTLETPVDGIKHCDHSDSGMANRIIGLASGSCVIQSLRTAGDASDAIIWTMFYLPLEAAATVAAA